MAMSEGLVDAMADRGIAWSLTLATAEKHVGPLATQDGPVGAYVRGRLDHVRRLLARASQRGVPLIAGTDEIGVGALAREAESLSRLGLTNTQAIAAISTSARGWLGFPPPEAGEPADVVTFATDPREDLSSLARPASVLFAGDLVPLA